MSEQKPARPPQVTLAGWLVMVGSVVVVLLAFGEVGDLRSLETREAVEEYLSKPPGDSLGLGVQGALSVLRVASMVAAACAAAAAILGYQVLQRSKGARLALSLLATPLFISGLVSGGIASAVVVAAIVMLWFQPARDWFDGITRAPEPRPAPPAPPETSGTTGTSGTPGAHASGTDPLLDLPPPTGPPLHPTPYASAPAPAPAQYPSTGPAPYRSTASLATGRPPAVRGACLLTWVVSGLAFLLMALTLVMMLAAPGTLIDEAHRQNPDLADEGISDTMLRTTGIVTSVVVMVWSAAAIALAALTWRRVRWAGTALAVSAGVAGAGCLLVVVLGSFPFLLPLAASAAVVSLLLRPESRGWLAGVRP